MRRCAASSPQQETCARAICGSPAETRAGALGSAFQGRTGEYVGGECRLESHFYALAERIRKLGDTAEMLDKSPEEEDVTVEARAKLFGIAVASCPLHQARGATFMCS